MPYRLLKRILVSSLIMLGAAFGSIAQSQQPTPQSNAQPPVKPCGAKPEYRQFDFWIGEWDVQAGGRHAGANSVQLILGDCVIFENWTGARGMTGKSFNIYNAAKGKWQQTWVDSTGNVLELYGEFKDGAMRLAGEKPGQKGGKIMDRITFFPLEGGRVRQLWESSQKVRVEENASSIESVTITGATAILTGTYQQKALLLPDKREIRVQGKFEAGWGRQPDGQWLIRRMGTQSAPPR
jgi:hypothetical protein